MEAMSERDVFASVETNDDDGSMWVVTHDAWHPFRKGMQVLVTDVERKNYLIGCDAKEAYRWDRQYISSTDEKADIPLDEDMGEGYVAGDFYWIKTEVVRYLPEGSLETHETSLREFLSVCRPRGERS